MATRAKKPVAMAAGSLQVGASVLTNVRTSTGVTVETVLNTEIGSLYNSQSNALHQAAMFQVGNGCHVHLLQAA